MSINNVARKREQAQGKRSRIEQIRDARQRALMFQDLAKQEMLTIERLAKEIENGRRDER